MSKPILAKTKCHKKIFSKKPSRSYGLDEEDPVINQILIKIIVCLVAMKRVWRFHEQRHICGLDNGAHNVMMIFGLYTGK